MSKVLFVQHGEFDKPGLLADALTPRGITLEIIKPYKGDPIPSTLDGFEGLAFGGGGQSAYEQDKYPYLAEEIRLIRQAAETDTPVIGLCLGAQLMAAALGAEVRPAAQKEIGLLPVELDPVCKYDHLFASLPQTLVVAHWHGDTFDLPPGAMRLASSLLTQNQAFRFGRALYALQFHLEMTPQIFSGLVEESRDDLAKDGFDPEELLRQAQQSLPKIQADALKFFDLWATLIDPRPQK